MAYVAAPPLNQAACNNKMSNASIAQADVALLSRALAGALLNNNLAKASFQASFLARVFIQLAPICAKASCALVMSARSACKSRPKAGATAATATEFASVAARCCTSAFLFSALDSCTRFANEALKPHAAKDGIAAWSSASKLPRCSPAAASSAACCLAAAAARGSNSGTATLSRVSEVLHHDASGSSQQNPHTRTHMKNLSLESVLSSASAQSCTTARAEAPSPSIVTQKLPKRGIFSCPLAVIAKTVLPSVDSAFALHSSIANAPPPALQELSTLDRPRSHSRNGSGGKSNWRACLHRREQRTCFRPCSKSVRPWVLQVCSHTTRFALTRRKGRAQSLSSSMTSRPSPAAMASKHGSKLTPEAPATKHCSPVPDVMPLQSKSRCGVGGRVADQRHCCRKGTRHLTNMNGPGSAMSAAELMPKYPQDCEPRMATATAFTLRGASNMNDSSNAASPRPVGCQHFASSKLAPSLEVMIFTSPGA